MAMICFGLLCSCQSDRGYQDPSIPLNERVEHLLNQMTWEEKLAQTWCFHLWDEMLDEQGNLVFEDEIAEALPLGVGQLGKPNWAFDKGPRESAELTNKIQKRVIESNRLGIPAIFHEEGLHGLWAREATVFPQAIGMSCSWDPGLIEEVFTVIAKEVRSRGGHQLNTPMLDVCRDPRWGRIEESYGEDPYLIGEFAKAIVTGLQGTSEVIGSENVIATVKHFAGYGITEGGLNKTPHHFGERYFREVILPPFQTAIMEAGALSVMPAYNEIDGIPAHANHWLLREVLREEWDFQGYVVSDYGGVIQLEDFHHVASDETNAGEIALLAGVDMELDNPYCYGTLLESVENSRDLQRALDQAVRNILTVKFKLGLFENPYIDPEEAERWSRADEHLQLSRKVAEESIVLLKNENNILPLNPSRYNSIAVIGPHANQVHYGGYSHIDKRNGITLLEGIKEQVGEKLEVRYAEGCRIHDGTMHWLDGPDDFAITDPPVNQRLIKEAVRVARRSDLVILAVGGTAVTAGEFIGHRHDLDLFGQQNELVNAIFGTGKPTIVCLGNGRPLTINAIDEKADAILETWYLGEQGGVALASTLFGEVNPSGKLTLTFPRSTGHLPMYYGKKESAIHDYLGERTTPLYPFGYGLSYTTFDYSELGLSAQEVKAGDELRVTVKLTNTGAVAGEEIAQLYVRDVVSSVTQPVMELKGFEKVSLAPGESKTVTLNLDLNQLKLYNQQMDHVLEPGEFQVMIGASSADIRLRDAFTVIN